MKSKLFLMLTLGIPLALAMPVRAQYPYEVIDLGVLSDETSQAYKINNYGQIAVTTFTGTSRQGAIWQPLTPNGKVGSLTTLGSLGGSYTTAYDINDYGQVVGASEDATGARYVYNWKPGTPNTALGSMTNLGIITVGQGAGINNFGQVTGSNQDNLPFLWTPSSANALSGMQTLPLPGVSYGTGYRINTGGQIAGSVSGAGGYYAFRFTPNSPNGGTGSFEYIESTPSSVGADINDSGTVAGWLFNDPSYNPATWSGTTGTNLSPTAFSGGGLGINNAGDVVGYVGYSASVRQAFLYQSGGTLTNLNTLIDPTSGWNLIEASDINDHGQIVGGGYYNGQYRAYLLAPAAAPEPGTLGLLALGTVAGIVTRRRSRGNV